MVPGLARLFGLLWLTTFAFAVGCTPSAGDDSGETGGEAGSTDGVGGTGGAGYVTDLPGSPNAQFPVGSAGGAIYQGPIPPSAEDLRAASAGAELTRIADSRMFAFSRNAGISVIDITDPAALTVVGTHRTAATPVELYVEGDSVLALSIDPVEHVYPGPVYLKSRLEVLDVSAVGSLSLVSEHSLVGALIATHRLGDFLYVATSENACGLCGDVTVHITSFDVSNPAQVVKAHELTLQPQVQSDTMPTATFVDGRIYVAIHDGAEKSTLHVVSFTSATGALTSSTTLPLTGRMPSSGKASELSGVARAFGQMGGTNSQEPIVLDTFDVASSTALAHFILTFSSGQNLSASAFDGDRAFVLTSDYDYQSTTLTIIDVSDPTSPKQRGSLALPGGQAGLEVRGNRVLVSGGARLAWLDVSEMTAPTLLSETGQGYFGASDEQSWLIDGELLAVPTNGFRGPGDCQIDFQGMTQLVRVASDELELLGAAEARGLARGALLHDGKLFTVSDKEVRTFDIADPSAPQSLSHADIARSVTRVVPAGDKVLRLGTEWWSDESALDLTLEQDADEAFTLSEVHLDALPRETSDSCEVQPQFSTPIVRGSWAYVARFVDVNSGPFGPHVKPTIFVLDLSDPNDLKVAFALDLEQGDEGERILQPVATDSALLVGRVRGRYDYDPFTDVRADVAFSYDVIDLSQPDAPVVASRFTLPEAVARGGFGFVFPHTRIDVGNGRGNDLYARPGSDWPAATVFVQGNVIRSQHEEHESEGRVRYYLDQLDVSDPAAPQLLPSVNIPGALASVEAGGTRLTTLDFEIERVAADSAEQCPYSGFVRFADGECSLYRRRVHSLSLTAEGASLLDSRTLDTDTSAAAVAVTPGVVFTLAAGKLGRLDLDSDGKLTEQPNIEAPGGSLLALGGRPFLFGGWSLLELDTSGETPTFVEHRLFAPDCDPQVSGSVLYCASEGLGAQRFELGN